MLSIAAGVSVSNIAGKYVFKNAAGEVILEANADAVDGLVSGGRNIESPKLDSSLMEELASSGVKYNTDDVVMITKTPDGKLLWLESGSDSAGLKHIVDGHAADFSARGINNIPASLNEVLQTTPISSGTTASGPFSVYSVDGSLYKIAYGTNGYIVTFYPLKKY